jgi:uncharacterized protein (DUF58 family)
MIWWFGAILLLLAGLVLRMGLLVYAMYVFLALLALSRWWTSRWLAALEVTRTHEHRLFRIGDTTRFGCSVRNRSRGLIPWLLLEDALPELQASGPAAGVRASGQRLAVVRLGGLEQRAFEQRVEFVRRGYYQFGPVLAETGDLFGLHRRHALLGAPAFATVLPDVIALESYDVTTPRPLGELRLAHRLYEDPTRLCGVRPYERGDPLNRIHWPATARTGVLHSRTFEPTCVAGATLVLDFHVASYPERGRLARQELAVKTVASLAHHLTLADVQVGLLSNGRDAADRVRDEGWQAVFLSRATACAEAFSRSANTRLLPVAVPVRRGSESCQDILLALARLEPTDGLTLRALVEETSSRMPRDASVIAVVPEATPELAAALGGLKRRGYAVFAVLVMFDEPAWSDWAEPSAGVAAMLAHGVPVRRVDDDASIAGVCASCKSGTFS